MRKLSYLAVFAIVTACQPTNQETKEESVPVYETPAHHSAALTKVLDAHGGYEKWSSMKSLSYVKGEESTVTNLQNRKIRIESMNQTIGFDGNEVWVTPDTVDVSRARFYHNLFFYFYAMPFVVGDPGAYYEDMEPIELRGKTYSGIKVSYGENIGDAPDDNYIIWYDQKSGKMEWLMYTVTYRSGEPSDKYSLIRYDEWTKFNDIELPTSLQWFQYDGETVGESRGDANIFKNVKISTIAPNDSLFAMPANAAIAPLNNAGS